uniref:RRM domain-containing protein n=2 Tax=Angiostrongylus TaxID=6312 RepID=A0A158PBD4_ANGCA
LKTHMIDPGFSHEKSDIIDQRLKGLRDYFGRFGEVNECMVMRDPATKRARGFGFITFVDPASVDRVLATEEHELDGKKIDPKVAFPKRSQTKMVTKTKKVFIGGLSASSTLEDMKTYFEQYGKVEDAMLMFDKATQRHRGFGFITFDNDEVSDKVCEIHFHEINGKMVECKKAQPKEVMLPVQLNKSRAAAARNLYGLPPEQLLAYATYLPRFGYGNLLYPNMTSSMSKFSPIHYW